MNENCVIRFFLFYFCLLWCFLWLFISNFYWPYVFFINWYKTMDWNVYDVYDNSKWKNRDHSFTVAFKDATDLTALIAFFCVQSLYSSTHCKYTTQAWHSVFYFDPLNMSCFSTKLSPFLFLFVCLFSFFVVSPILGLRSLAGGRREYGRSGREPLYSIFFVCFSYILSVINIFTW